MTHFFACENKLFLIDLNQFAPHKGDEKMFIRGDGNNFLRDVHDVKRMFVTRYILVRKSVARAATARVGEEGKSGVNFIQRPGIKQITIKINVIDI